MEKIRAIRRLGRLAGDPTTGATGSPDVLELENGDFAIVGWDITGQIDLSILPGVHCAPGERTVQVGRAILVNARRDIPDA